MFTTMFAKLVDAVDPLANAVPGTPTNRLHTNTMTRNSPSRRTNLDSRPLTHAAVRAFTGATQQSTSAL